MEKGFIIFARLLVILGAVLIARQVQAHDYWLEPDHFQVRPGQEIQLKLFLGQDFQAEKEQVLQADRIPSMDLYASPLRRTDLFRAECLDKSPVAIFSVKKPGTWLVALERNLAVISFGRKGFFEYLQHEGINLSPETESFPSDRKSVRERYQRSLKTLLQCGDKTSRIATSPIHQPLQIVAMQNPYRLPLPGKLGFKVLYQGKPLAATQVTIAHRLHGKISVVRKITNGKGMVSLPVQPEGRWLVRCVHLERAPVDNPQKADWESWWTSLTFGYD